MCGVVIKMDSGETLKTGPCAADQSLVTEQKTYEFNSNTNMFLSVGGIPSTGWQAVGAQGIKQFFTMTLQSFYAEFDLGASPHDFWITPPEKHVNDLMTLQYPKFIQKAQCASSILQYGLRVELFMVNDNDGSLMLLPDWISTSQTALSVRLTNRQQLGRAHTMRLIASLPQDPEQRTIKQTFQINIHNPCNNGNRVVWTSAAKEAKVSA